VAIDKVTLLGGSNSLKSGGLKTGISKKVQILNLALGASSTNQNLYELIRNKDEISKTDLIITESNVNDFHNLNMLDGDIEVVKRNIEVFYAKLAEFRIPVVVILLPLQTKRFRSKNVILDKHRSCSNLYGFNIIDMHDFFHSNGLNEFFYFDNLDHPLLKIMERLGEVIVDSKSDFLLHNEFENIDFKVDVIVEKSNSEIMKIKKNSLFKELCMPIEAPLIMDATFLGYEIIGFHTWSDTYSCLNFTNNNKKISKHVNDECQFHDLYESFIIDDTSYIDAKYYDATELSMRVSGVSKKKNCGNVNLINIMVYKRTGSSIMQNSSIGHKYKVHNNLLNFIFELKDITYEYTVLKSNCIKKQGIIRKLAWLIFTGETKSIVKKKFLGLFK
jgi:hypothetical protein